MRRPACQGIRTLRGSLALSSWIALCAVIVMASSSILSGCSKKEVDPVEYVKAMIPKIQDGLNRRDIAGLQALGTSKFEANSFITDVFTHGVEGDVTLAMTRVRHVPGNLFMILSASFGNGGSGGAKELTIYFAGEKKWKIDSYSLRDKSIPEPGPRENIFDSVPPQTVPTEPL